MGIVDDRLQVDIAGGLQLNNPIMTASGTFGYGNEFSNFVDLDRLGAIIVKGISLKPRPGNPPPRIVETSCGMLNAIGLENVGLDNFISEKMPFLRKIKAPVIVNILGDSLEEYQTLSEKLNDTSGISAIEVNISCPNVKRGGVAFGTDPAMVFQVTESVKSRTSRPVIVKLSPNVTDITATAQAAEDGGADAISLINTLLGMAVDHRARRPRLANIVGGLSGPAIKPVALRMVWQAANVVRIPVIGIGGIMTVEDVLEFMIAGASAVQIGTANLIEPDTTEKVLDGLLDYVEQNGGRPIREIIGTLQTG
ncbi:MAG: dihydroorotate dehydrogenase [Desulfurivibrionaceae bacterium]|nr:dihydroorotate dehydrogenase [Desulfobulbales bacterium]MDT8334660.1 dihydroorotate dehydrogenase [Desulfurivibrionaceae bacterium]